MGHCQREPGKLDFFFRTFETDERRPGSDVLRTASAGTWLEMYATVVAAVTATAPPAAQIAATQHHHPRRAFLLATRIHKSGNLIYATVAFIAHSFFYFFFGFIWFLGSGLCFAFVNLKLPANAINSQCSLNI